MENDEKMEELRKEIQRLRELRGRTITQSALFLLGAGVPPNLLNEEIINCCDSVDKAIRIACAISAGCFLNRAIKAVEYDSQIKRKLYK